MRKTQEINTDIPTWRGHELPLRDVFVGHDRGADQITVLVPAVNDLEGVEDKPPFKTHRRDPDEPTGWKTNAYGGGEDDEIYWWKTLVFPISSLDDLAAIVGQVEDNRGGVIIRGRPDPEIIAKVIDDPAPLRVGGQDFNDWAVPRLKKPRTDDRTGVFWRPNGRRWIAFDLDDVPAPEGLDGDDPKSRQKAAKWAIREYLPECFHDAACFVQWTASAGVKGWDELRLRLWFWADRPVCGESLAENIPGDGIDTGIWTDTVKILYVAAPRFEDETGAEIDDPIFGEDSRSFRLDGAPEVKLPDSYLDREQWEAEQQADKASADRTRRRKAAANSGLTAAPGEIREQIDRDLTADCEELAGLEKGAPNTDRWEGRDCALRNLAYKYARFVKSDLFDEAEARERLEQAARESGLGESRIAGKWSSAMDKADPADESEFITGISWEAAGKRYFFGESVGMESLNDDGDRTICASDVWPVGKAVKPNGEHGAMIRFLPEGRGRARGRFISAKAWNDNQKAEAATLAAEGVKIVPDKGPALLRLVGLWTRFEAERIIKVADRSGWHFTEGGALYVNGPNVYGADDLGAEWRAEGPHTERRGRERGDFDEWQQGIAELATTDGLRYMLGLSLAGPFVGGLKIIGRDVGSFMPHFCGPSSTGKSKGAKLAQSVWSGATLPSWNATKNAVENLAEFSSGALLVLDEIKEAQSWAVKKIIHTFSDGAGRAKQRRDRNALRRNLEWSAVGISTGENTVAQVLGEDYQGGHAVRSPDLWCDRGDLCTDREHADQIGRLAARHYGAAGNRWAETLADWTPDDWHDLESEIDDWRDDFADLVVDDPEAGRILDNFILAAVAYRRAAAAGVLPFGAEEAGEHARSFLRWAMGKVRDERGEATNPDARAYQNIRRSFATQPNRFPTENDYGKGDVRGAVVGVAETDTKGKTGAVWLCEGLADDSDEFKGAGTNWRSFRQWAEGEGLILEEKTPGRVGGVNRRWKKIALDGMADESPDGGDEKISVGLSVVGG